MPLTLRVQTYHNQPTPALISKRFTVSGGTLGRSPGNDLVLGDPSKYISRTHARVTFREGNFYLADLGSNPSIINDRPLGNGRETMLANGDKIQIGEYLIEALVEQEAVAPAAAPTASTIPPLFEPPLPPQLAPPPLFQPPAAAPQPAYPTTAPDPLAAARILDVASGTGHAAAGSNSDPLGLNLFGGAPVADPDVPQADSLAPAFRGAESDHISPEIQPFPGIPGFAKSISMTIPDDYDPLADYVPKQVPVPRPEPVPVPSVPQTFLAEVAASPATQMPEPIIPAMSVAPQEVDSATVMPIHNAAKTLNPIIPAASHRTDSLQLAPAPAAGSDSEVLQALLKGLGLPDLKINRSGPELAELVGAMLREATAGTMGALVARSLTKRESRIEMTMIASQANNPLKFFPDAGSALTQMLTNSMPGYMRPVKAVSNAFDDLKAHELAVIAGMRSALSSVLHRFNPAAIEERLKVPTVMDKVLASNRKAKMWDRLVDLYEDISREADDDFQRLFGEKFATAYEEQIERLRKSGH
jgi:FHA domain-containing protein/type VI secretion system protein